MVRVLVGFVRGRSCTVIHLEDKECEIVSLHSSLSRGTLLLPRAGHRGVPSNLPNSRHYFGKPQTPQLLLLRPCPCTHYLFHVKPSDYTRVSLTPFGSLWLIKDPGPDIWRPRQDSKLPLGSGHLGVFGFGRDLVLPVLSVLGARKMTLVNY
ncbi:hypothetical protein Pmani_016812 [Petrolisthes manimaculis]|uniref:Uncharacterized protein n=1 Tax=Petrolisthes manimaculis TaxID=1843537 RepID=A0AAE1PPM0_9EUCA|nr:hypothetical protein Pmani_016812 [Petrolisthes manimaculis]